MNRRNTVSVTPAIGASTVAGRIAMPPNPTMEARASPPVRKHPSMPIHPATPARIVPIFPHRMLSTSPILMLANSVLTNKTPVCPGVHDSLTSARRRQNLLLNASPALPYLRRKRSTRPAVSISFCLPVKNGWHAAQISTEIWFFASTASQIGSRRRNARASRCTPDESLPSYAPQPFLRIPLF